MSKKIDSVAVASFNNFIQQGQNNDSFADRPNIWERIRGAIAMEEPPEDLVVEGALVVCTGGILDEIAPIEFKIKGETFTWEGRSAETSESQMIKTYPSNVDVNGASELTHKDIEFYPLFPKCRYCDSEECKPNIPAEQWYDFDGDNQINDAFGILEEKSFMVCYPKNGTGTGLLYITEDGQRCADAERSINIRKIGRCPNSAFWGDPVNMATGNFVFARTDLEIKGNVPLKFQRFYNVMDSYHGVMGKNWTHPYDIKLSLTKEGVTIRFEDGHEMLYKTLGNEKKAGYQSPDGVSLLSKVGNGYRLKKADETILHFNEKG